MGPLTDSPEIVVLAWPVTLTSPPVTDLIVSADGVAAVLLLELELLAPDPELPALLVASPPPPQAARILKTKQHTAIFG